MGRDREEQEMSREEEKGKERRRGGEKRNKKKDEGMSLRWKERRGQDPVDPSTVSPGRAERDTKSRSRTSEVNAWWHPRFPTAHSQNCDLLFHDWGRCMRHK